MPSKTCWLHSFTARPDIQILVNAETIDGSHYQSVSCSAVGGRPTPQISWLVNSLPPTDYPFTVDVSETVHSNGTSTLSSILRFPTHLQDEDSVTCVVQHPTLPTPKLTTVRVETYSKLALTAERVGVVVFVHLCCQGVTYCIASPEFYNHASWLSISQQHNNFLLLIFQTGCSFSLCSTYPVTDHKSHCAVQCIHVGVHSFTGEHMEHYNAATTQ